MRGIVWLPLLIAFESTSCASASLAPSRTAMSPSEVTRNAQALKGKTVLVEGYFIVENEAHALWDTKDDADEVVRRRASGGDPIWTRCIAIYFDKTIARKLKAPTRGDILVTGTIGVTDHDKDGVDLWACSDTYIEVHRLVRK